MKIIYNMDELAKKLGTGKITSIVVTDLCLCVECSEKQEKYFLTTKPAKPISKKSKPQPNHYTIMGDSKTQPQDKLKDFMDKMAGPRF